MLIPLHPQRPRRPGSGRKGIDCRDRTSRPGARPVDRAGCTVEVLASGYDWSEGPVWVKDGGFLLFSDVPPNVILQVEGRRRRAAVVEAIRLHRQRATRCRTGIQRAHHRPRRAACHLPARRSPDRTDGCAARRHPAPKFSSVADRHDGARFNSPERCRVPQQRRSRTSRIRLTDW